VSTVTQVQVRCTGCRRRLCDYLGELEAGQVILELKCPRCGQPHTEIIRPPAGGPSISRKAGNKAGGRRSNRGVAVRPCEGTDVKPGNAPGRTGVLRQAAQDSREG
jgi:hypothetical protein